MDPVAGAVLDLAESRPATLGVGRLICVDGPAGSGKTTLAASLQRLRASVRVVHLDDLYDGWGGLATVDEQLERLLRPLADGLTGRYRRYDWIAGGWAETVAVDPADLLVLEGVGSGARRVADLVTTLVWVEAPDDLRLGRGLRRDGEQARGAWLTWMQDEVAVHRLEATRERADVLVDGTGTTPPLIRAI